MPRGQSCVQISQNAGFEELSLDPEPNVPSDPVDESVESDTPVIPSVVVGGPDEPSVTADVDVSLPVALSNGCVLIAHDIRTRKDMTRVQCFDSMRIGSIAEI